MELEISCFTENDYDYLKEYVTIMEPIAKAIDFVQGENDTFYGNILPTLATIKVKLSRLSSILKILTPLVERLMLSFEKRFDKYFNLDPNVNDVIIASYSCPWVKTNYLKVIKGVSTKNYIRDIVLAAISSELRTSETEEPVAKKNSFFDSGEGETNSTANVSTTEIEMLEYETDKNETLVLLSRYPHIKKLFRKYNCILLSSAAVERLFSFAQIVNSPRRCSLSDNNFEHVLFLKCNQILF